MKTGAAVFGVLLGLTAGVLAGATPAKAVDPKMRLALQAARTVRLEVRQDYDFTVTPEEKEEKESKTAGEKPAEKFSLPLAEMASEALKLAGWKVVGPDEAADLTLTVKASGQALGAEYTGTIPGFHYSGAELSGSVQLEQGDRIITAEPFAGKVPVDSIIHRSYWKPESAPFFQTLPHFCTALFTVIGRAVGPAPLVAGMKLENFEQQAGAGRALMTEGNASVTPALIELLEPGDRLAARPAALGLGVFGDAAALPPLLAALRKDTSNVSSVKYNDEFDNELLNSLTGDFDEPLPPAERATAAGRGLDEFWTLHRAVEWALVQIVAPGKIELLTAALLSPDSVMLRRGAAVVFGCLKDPRAFGPLAAAARDKEPIVRAAAVAALGRLPDERKVDLLLAASADATDYVSKLARDQLAEIAQERWRKFLQARTPQNARWDQIPVSLLRAGFADADPLVRASAARLTIYRTEPELLAGLAALLQADGSALVREAVTAMLEEGRDDRNSPVLALALGDSDAATRWHAVKGLTQFSSEDQEAPEKKAARSQLPESALGPVCHLLAQREFSAPEAGELLERIVGPGVADALLRMLPEDRPPAVMEVIARELARRGDKRTGPPLLALLAKATDFSDRLFLADVLVTLADPKLLEPLFGQLKQGPLAARRLAANVLGRLGQPRAIGPLIAALRAGRSGDLASTVREALLTLTGKTFETGDQWLAWWKENAGKPFTPPPRPPAEN